MTRRMRGGATAFVGVVALLTLALRARASVSIAVLFDELVQRARAVAVVTPVEQSGVVEDGRIVTYTRVHVDRLVAGSMGADVWLRALGGAVGRIGQIVQGQPTFELGQPALVFARPGPNGAAQTHPDAWSVVEAAQGEYSVVKGSGQEPRLATAKDVGGLVAPNRPSVEGRFARDVLVDRSVEEAAREIQGAWTRLHPR